MSQLLYTTIRRCRTSTLTTAQQRLLIDLADRADEQGECFPSRETMQSDVGLKSVRTVDACLDALISAGALVVVPAHRRSRTYRVIPEGIPQRNLQPLQGSEGGNPATIAGVNLQPLHGTLQPLHPNPATIAPETPTDAPTDPPSEPDRVSARASGPDVLNLALAVALACMQRDCPGKVGLRLPDHHANAVRAAVGRGWNDETLSLQWDFFQLSFTGIAGLAKSGEHPWHQSWKSILKPGTSEEYLEEARAWDARGRIDLPRKARAPPRESRFDDGSVSDTLRRLAAEEEERCP